MQSKAAYQLLDASKPNHQPVRYFQYFLLLCLLLYVFFLFVDTTQYMRQFNNHRRRVSHNLTAQDYVKHADTLDELQPDSVRESIFFIETRVNATSEQILLKRQACAVESAALNNPGTDVYVLFPLAEPSRLNLSVTNAYVRALLDYPNVKLRHISMTEYMRGTMLEEWYATNPLSHSSYPLAHTSDVLRLLTLWKFGGIYLDLDTVTMRSFNGLGAFAALESGDTIGNAVIGAPHTGIGHEVMSMALNTLPLTYRGDLWAENGPILLTNTMRDVCNLTLGEQLDKGDITRCHGFNIHPIHEFYRIHWSEWMKYFSNGTEADKMMAQLQDSYTVHIWNKLSSEETVYVGSNQPYARLAKRFCPSVYKNIGKTF